MSTTPPTCSASRRWLRLCRTRTRRSAPLPPDRSRSSDRGRNDQTATTTHDRRGLHGRPRRLWLPGPLAVEPPRLGTALLPSLAPVAPAAADPREIPHLPGRRVWPQLRSPRNALAA